MTEDRSDHAGAGKRPANDNDPSGQSRNDGGTVLPNPETLRRIDTVVLQLARLIGRRMAREDFAARIAAAANDNDPDNQTPS